MTEPRIAQKIVRPVTELSVVTLIFKTVIISFVNYGSSRYFHAEEITFYGSIVDLLWPNIIYHTDANS